MKDKFAICITPAQAKIMIAALQSLDTTLLGRAREQTLHNAICELRFGLEANEKRND